MTGKEVAVRVHWVNNFFENTVVTLAMVEFRATGWHVELKQ